MDDLIRVVIMIGSMVGLSVGAYAGVAVVSIIKRRYDPPVTGAAPDELELIHARLASVDELEARVNELEERVDFAERLVARQQESERLPSGQPLDHR